MNYSIFFHEESIVYVPSDAGSVLARILFPLSFHCWEKLFLALHTVSEHLREVGNCKL